MNMKHICQRWIYLSLLSVMALSSITFAQNEREYIGAINKTILIRMKISRSGDVIRGTYRYEKIGKDLQLNGRVEGQKITLYETDAKGNRTGMFVGRLEGPDSIEGTWSNADGTRSLPFAVIASRTTRPTATPASDDIGGEYARVDAKGRLEKESGATINVRTLANGLVEIAGEATLVIDAKRGNVRTGNVEGKYKLNGNKLSVKGAGEYDCAMTLTFGKGRLAVTGDNGNCGGLSVSFDGDYKRIGAAKFQ
jgi:hypothetical protein